MSEDACDVGYEGEASWRRCKTGCGVGGDKAEEDVIGICRGVDLVGGDEDRNAGGGIGGIAMQVAGLVETMRRRVWRLQRGVDRV